MADRIIGNLSGGQSISGGLSGSGELSVDLDNTTNEIVGNLSGGQSLTADLSGSGELSVDFNTENYNSLVGKPILNGTTIKGNKTSEDYSLATVYFDTVSGWNEQSDLVSVKNAVYVYTDYQDTEEGKIAGVKVGDGTTYVVDLPFTDKLVREHMADTEIHVTAAEKEFWNAKNRAVAYGETLLLTDL